MRLAVLVDPRPTEPVPPAVRGERILWLRDSLVRLGFEVVALSEQPDEAQLDRVLAGVEPGDSVLVHVSGQVAAGGAVRIGLAQSLGLSALAASVEAKSPSSVLYFVELTFGGPVDALKAAEHAAHVRSAIESSAPGDVASAARSALIAIGARTPDRDPLAFTRLALRAAEELTAMDEDGVALSTVVERLRALPESAAVAQSYALVRGATEFRLSPAAPEKPALEPLLLLADGARQSKKWDQALSGYRAALLVAVAPAERGPIHARIGDIEQERGNALKALRAYERAYAACPDDASARDAVIATALESEEWARALPPSRVRLSTLQAPADRVDELFSIARLLGKLGDMPAAVTELECARAIDPKNGDVLEALRRAYKVLSRWSKLLEVTGVLADLALTPLERAARLVAQAHIAVDHLADEDRAVHFLEAALDDDPTHDEALELLVELRSLRGERERLTSTLEGLLERYSEMGDTEREAEASRRIEEVRDALDADDLVPDADASQALPASTGSVASRAGVDAAPDTELPDTQVPAYAERVDAKLAAADIADAELPDTALAIKALALDETPQAADVSPQADASVEPRPEASVDAHESPAEQTAEGPFEAVAPLAEPSEAPLTAIQGRSPSAPMSEIPPAAVASPSQGGLSQDTDVGSMPDLTALARLDDSSAVLHQDDSTLELEESRRKGMTPESLESLEELVTASPLDASLHQRLFAYHMSVSDSDRAYLEALALEELGALEQEHEDLLEQCRPDGLRVRATLDATGWSELQAPGGDDVVDALFGAVGRAAIAVYVDERRSRRKLAALDPSRRLPESSTASIVRSFHWAARVLDVPCPELYVLDTVFGDIAAVPAREPSTVVGPAVLRGLRTKDLAFLAGRHLAYYRPGFDVLLYFPTLSELTALLLAGVRVVLPEMPMPKAVAPKVEALASGLTTRLTGEERVALANAVHRLEARGGRVDLTAWSRSVELTAGRAGLLLCGDLRTAMTRLQTETRTIAAVTLEERRADLLACCSSRGMADLRARVSIVASSPPPRSSGMMARGDVTRAPDWASGFEPSSQDVSG